MNIRNKFKNMKKGQGLPLDTIVIAVLVIIVLLVIIVFFVSKMGDAGSKYDGASDGMNDCTVGSYIVPGDTYSDTAEISETKKCEEGWVRIYSAKTSSEKKTICCAHKITPKKN